MKNFNNLMEKDLQQFHNMKKNMEICVFAVYGHLLKKF